MCVSREALEKIIMAVVILVLDVIPPVMAFEYTKIWVFWYGLYMILTPIKSIVPYLDIGYSIYYFCLWLIQSIILLIVAVQIGKIQYILPGILIQMANIASKFYWHDAENLEKGAFVTYNSIGIIAVMLLYYFDPYIEITILTAFVISLVYAVVIFIAAITHLKYSTHWKFITLAIIGALNICIFSPIVVETMPITIAFLVLPIATTILAILLIVPITIYRWCYNRTSV